MIIQNISYIYIFFFKFLVYLNIFTILVSFILAYLQNFVGNIISIKARDIIQYLKNILLSNLLVNFFISILLLYLLLYNYKCALESLLLESYKYNLLYSHFSCYYYSFDFDIFNVIFYSLAILVAFISLLALDTRIYSSKAIFIVLCNLLVLIIFLFSFTNNYVLFFIFYELLLIPSFFFVYKISPAKTSIQSSIYFVM